MTRPGSLILGVILLMASPLCAQEPINLGSRLELLVDEELLSSLSGGAHLQLHQPVRREIVFETDKPWEGNASGYQSIVHDGNRYRLYYRGGHYLHSGPAAQGLENHPWNLCCAESDDGIHWTRPELGIYEFKGSKANNIVLTPETVSQIGGDPAHTSVFFDQNPACPADERYKIVILGSKPTGLYILKSGDGYHFSLLSPDPVITEGAFDSENLAFWDPVRKEYREYHRGFNKGVRDILTAVSPDIRHFPKPEWLQYPGAPAEHLYVNQVMPYYRAPHLFVGFPARYTERAWSEPLFSLPGREERIVRGKSHPRYATAVTDALFMSSRDGLTFKRWPEAFLRPGPRQKESWVYGDNYILWGMAETRSDTEDAPNELSIYATEGYWEGLSTSIRRYTLRIDGFVSVQAPLAGGEFVTKPLLFEGGCLALNMETSGAGGVQVELQDAAGQPIEGYRLDQCPPILGDTLRHLVRWQSNDGKLEALAGTPVRLRMVLKDADLYSFQFVPYEPSQEVPPKP